MFSMDRSKIYDISIKEHKEKRSLNANAYLWSLVGKIAEASWPPMDKEMVYLEMLKAYGQSELITVKNEVPIEKYFKYYEEIKKGDKFTAYKVYQGSSSYDTQEMAKLIDGVVMEAKNLGLETMTPAQISVLKNAWEAL